MATPVSFNSEGGIMQTGKRACQGFKGCMVRAAHTVGRGVHAREGGIGHCCSP